VSHNLAVIPRPQRVTRIGSGFTLNTDTVLTAIPALAEVADLIGTELRLGSGLPLP